MKTHNILTPASEVEARIADPRLAELIARQRQQRAELDRALADFAAASVALARQIEAALIPAMAAALLAAGAEMRRAAAPLGAAAEMRRAREAATPAPRDGAAG